jgi:hypothetical protein
MSINWHNFDYFESKLKDEYKGHPYTFWQAVQQFHDSNFNWNEKGLSDQGLINYIKLKEEYKDK